MVEECYWSGGDASEKSDHFIWGVAESLNAEQQFEYYEPSNEDGIDDEDRIYWSKEVNIDVELSKDEVGVDDGLHAKKIILNRITSEVIEMFHSLSIWQGHFDSGR